FVAALDVMGSWPPRQDLHLEMDGSFATYYAWLKMQTGEVDTAIVCGHGKVSEGEPERVLNLQLDPYYQAPLGLTPTATAALPAPHRRGGPEGEPLPGAPRRARPGLRRDRRPHPPRRRAQPRQPGARGGDGGGTAAHVVGRRAAPARLPAAGRRERHLSRPRR